MKMKPSTRICKRGNLSLAALSIAILVLSLGRASGFPAAERAGLIPVVPRPVTPRCRIEHQDRCTRSHDPYHWVTTTRLNLSRGGPPTGRSYQDGSDNDDRKSSSSKNDKKRFGRKEGRRNMGRSSTAGQGFGVSSRRGGGASNSTTTSAAVMDPPDQTRDHEVYEQQIEEMTKRMTQLEHFVAKQSVEIRRLKEECRSLQEAAQSFHHVVELLRAAGLQTDELPSSAAKPAIGADDTTTNSLGISEKSDNSLELNEFIDEDDVNLNDDDEPVVYEYFDDTEIFGEAPASVTDAADHAGASILAGLLGGKQRMLIDVRDSELSRDPETLVQFIELAILPVAAGLEGLISNRNRVKIVFPTVSQLLQYRKTMALAAPEVVALSTLGFDPVEERDNIVVIVAPPPDDEEGLQVMNELLDPPEWKQDQRITQPVVVLNHHMVPLTGPAATYDVMYHLRLLSVQYMSGERADSLFESFDDDDAEGASNEKKKPDDAILEEAMRHAHEAGVNHGVTRAMVIRAYPKPWHVFVDISPDTDADFVVAATFDDEPRTEDVNAAIVECIEGSEREDEIVAQQMQQAFEIQNEKLDMTVKDESDEEDDDDDDDDEEDWYNLWTEDSI